MNEEEFDDEFDEFDTPPETILAWLGTGEPVHFGPLTQGTPSTVTWKWAGSA